MQVTIFRLVRFFFVTSAAVAIVITIMLVLHRQSEVRRLIDFAERQNVMLAQSFANTIWPRFSSYVMSASSFTPEELGKRPEGREIQGVVREISVGLPVLKIKIYNLNGLTVYSSDSDQIGENKSTNPGYFSAAKRGTPASKLTFRDSFSSFEGAVQDRDLVESYLPIRQGDGQIEGVFELYTDVTPLMAEIRRDTTNLTIGTVLIFAMLYALLLLIVRRADHTIKQQYVDITEKNSALSKEIAERELAEEALKRTHDELERRVEQRTRELTVEITERKQAEESLRRLSQAVEQSPAMTIITDPTGSIEYVNPRFTEVTGYALEEIAGKTPRVLKSGKTLPAQYDNLWEAITAGKEWRGEFHNRKKNGALYWATTSICPITNEDRILTHFLGISEDISERKRAEDEARQHRNELAHFGRVSVIGEMATSLAHELNQPLTVISGCAQFCLNSLRSKPIQPEDLVDPLEQAAEQAERANEIIRRVRSFIQKEDQQRKEIEVNTVIRDVTGLLQTDAREHGATIKLTLADQLPPVLADSIQIQQVVVNLAHNGIEVMSDIPSEARVLTIHTRGYRRNAIEVVVHDTGPEIAAENLEKVFDPFFTTKTGGLGMGLSISRSIVEAHGGSLWATSSQDGGTSFHFTLPAVGSKRGEDN